MSEKEVRVVERLEEIPEPVLDAEFVVVDVIISSTAVGRLLAEGAECVKTFGEAEDALAFGRKNDAVLVGEQGGGPIEGFDLSPLPSVFGEHDIEGRPVGMMTTNGTRAVEKIGKEENVFFGSTVNADAVADALRERGRDAFVVAAGRYGEKTPEDTAGAELIREMYKNGGTSEERAEEFRRSIRESGTASWIDDLGYWHEIEALLEFNESETVPRMRDGVFVD
jgi:2-phosphosulfolactate phosphatase